MVPLEELARLGGHRIENRWIAPTPGDYPAAMMALAGVGNGIVAIALAIVIVVIANALWVVRRGPGDGDGA